VQPCPEVNRVAACDFPLTPELARPPLSFPLEQNIPVRELCKGLPPEFGTLLCYARNLKFDENPNYNYCRKLLREVFEQV
jgi:hypothetical protein